MRTRSAATSASATAHPSSEMLNPFGFDSSEGVSDLDVMVRCSFRMEVRNFPLQFQFRRWREGIATRRLQRMTLGLSRRPSIVLVRVAGRLVEEKGILRSAEN